MKKILGLFLFFVSFSACSYASDTLRLADALKSKILKIKAVGNGGFSGEALKLHLENTGSQDLLLRIDAGQIFKSEDEAAQNLMVTQTAFAEIAPKGKKEKNVWTMCIESHDHSPYANSSFSVLGMASGDLLKLAKMIDEKDYQNSTAQSAVWAITNGASIKDIYGTDLKMAQSLANFVANVRREPPPTIIARPHNIVSLRAKMGFLCAKDNTKASLILCDSVGTVLETVFKDRPMKGGLNIQVFGINRIEAAGKNYWLKLQDSEGNLIREMKLNEKMPETDPQVEDWQVSFEFGIEKAVSKAYMGIFDAKGKLVRELVKSKDYGFGDHRLAFGFKHFEGSEAVFWIRLLDQNQKNLAEQKIDKTSVKIGNNNTLKVPDNQSKMKLDLEFSYYFRETTDSVTLKVFDAAGAEVQQVFENKKFERGQFKKSFQMLLDRNGRYFVRLKRKDYLLKELEIK